MRLGTQTNFGWDPSSDFRSKATFGVAIAALTLLLPVAFFDFYLGKTAIGIGAMSVVFILGANAWTVAQGQCHQNLTLLGLFPTGMLFMIGVFFNDGVIATVWCFPIIIAGYCMLTQQRAWIANAIVLSIAIPMTWATLNLEYAIRITATLGAVSLFSAILVSVIDEQRQQLEYQMNRDPLTGLLNRLSLKKSLQAAIDHHNQDLHKYSLLTIDIDHFKKINDTRGHDCGDRILQEFSALLNTELRQDDSAFRTGGEEFLVILKFTDELTAIEIGERVRRTVESHKFEDKWDVTVSVGIAGYIRGETWNAWTKRADDRLYAAKHAGRNRVIAFDSNKPDLSTLRAMPSLAR